jgi:hypothetical protein
MDEMSPSHEKDEGRVKAFSKNSFSAQRKANVESSSSNVPPRRNSLTIMMLSTLALAVDQRTWTCLRARRASATPCSRI